MNARETKKIAAELLATELLEKWYEFADIRDGYISDASQEKLSEGITAALEERDCVFVELNRVTKEALKKLEERDKRIEELEKALRGVVQSVQEWNAAMETVIGKQPKTPMDGPWKAAYECLQKCPAIEQKGQP